MRAYSVTFLNLQVFAGSPVPSIHQPSEWDLLSVNPSSLETLSHLRDENQELSHRIHQIVEERDYFENSLSKVQVYPCSHIVNSTSLA